MTLYGVLVSIGGVVLAAIIIKGFWSMGSIKTSDARNKWHGGFGSGDSN